jgi:DNA-binding PadR family transcriptional regulator
MVPDISDSDMYGYLRIFVLRELARGECTGYDLMKKYEEFTGTKMVSPGTIYPLLTDLRKKKLILLTVMEKKDTKKVYRISIKGKTALHELMEERKRALNSVIATFHPIASKKELTQMQKSFKMLTGNLKVERDFDVWNDLKSAIVDFASSDKYDKNRQIFRNVLIDATKKIRKLK